MHAYSAD